jgi:filamentous hemagglutinin
LRAPVRRCASDSSEATNSDVLGGLSSNQLAALRAAGLSDAEIADHIQTLGDVQLFRGTSRGFPGNPVLQKLGITPASTDPLVATIFSLEGKAVGGDAVVLNGGMRNFAGGDIDLGNVRSSLEREVQVNMPPSQFEAQAPNAIPVDVARQILSDMGIADLPPTITNSYQATQILESTPRLTPEQIQEFLQRAAQHQ